ncbi:MAG: DUF1846 domain-containing protein [Erysipelotrichaceae bacterium]|nr:DUF1846 domain-containing protein [Erysipelotrichaceae bacterium]
MKKLGFDNDKYIKLQSEKIKERIGKFDNKLYLEFGGKLFDDFHASRVLPGFMPDSKIRLLMELKDKAEIVMVINAADIEKKKVRSDLDITYDLDVLRLYDVFKDAGLYVSTVVIAQYAHQPLADAFKTKCENLGLKVALHYPIMGYPSDIEHIVSPEGLGKNDWIETERELVVITAPGPGSGKLATCLSQLYHDHQRGIKSGYAKFETFPIWNIPLKHPVNLAYEAATADLNDVNMIDPFHLEAYEKMSVNYNRDVDAFPLLTTLFEKIAGECIYKSPTDMGVNMCGYCISDDDACKEASYQEIIRRYYSTLCDVRKEKAKQSEVDKIAYIMQQAGITKEYRKVVKPALEIAEKTDNPACAIELADGRIFTGKTTELLGSACAALLNSMKAIAGLDDDLLLLKPEIIKPIQELKVNRFHSKNPRLHTDEVLIALSITAVNDENARKCLEALNDLKGAEMHSTVMLSHVDRSTLKKLGILLTCEPEFRKTI